MMLDPLVIAQVHHIADEVDIINSAEEVNNAAEEEFVVDLPVEGFDEEHAALEDDLNEMLNLDESDFETQYNIDNISFATSRYGNNEVDDSDSDMEVIVGSGNVSTVVLRRDPSVPAKVQLYHLSTSL